MEILIAAAILIVGLFIRETLLNINKGLRYMNELKER